jgi:hypothetical protein
MENQDPSIKIKKMKAPSKEMVEYYRSLYERNQTKFMRRSILEIEHLGSEFEYDGSKYILLGSVDALLMLVKDQDENYYMMSSSIPTKQILGKT